MDRDQGGTLTGPGSDALTLRPLTGRAAEMAALQSVLEAAPAYFWQRLGYIETGEVKLAEPGGFPIAVLEKPLARTPRA